MSHSSAEAIFALELQAVNKQFSSGSRSVNALRSVSLTIDKGAVVGLVGPDGAGKTTLLRLTAGLLLPDTGTIPLCQDSCRL